MAIYHLTAKMISRSSGRSSVASVAYRAGEKIRNERDGRIHDYSRRTGVVYSEIMLPQNSPEEFQIRSTLWNAVEHAEKRTDSQTAREVEVALPREFDLQDNIWLLQDYIEDNFVSQGMCADFSIHDKEDGNPHAHIMLTTRHVTNRGFGGKNRDWNDKQLLQSWRENWADICNERLAEHGHDETIDHRKLSEQGFERRPTIHEGRSEMKAEYNREIMRYNKRFLPESVAERMNDLQDKYAEVEEKLQQHTEKRREIQRLDYKAKEMTERADQIRDEYGREYFKRIYGIEPEQAGAEVQKIKAQSEDLKHELQDKIQSLTDEKNRIEQEYQRQKLIIQSRPDREDILKRLKHNPQLERHFNPSPREQLAKMQREKREQTRERGFSR